MKLIFDESYGELSHAQRAAYRKFNVSPMDHDCLVTRYGATAHAEITAAVKRCSPNGMFTVYAMWGDLA